MALHQVVVLGGSGFVGRHVVARLATAGHRVIVPSRRRENARHLILLPTVDVVETDVNEPRALRELLAGATAVINLVGILNETGGATFERAHVELARNLVDACRAAGVTRLLQMSALGADPAGPSRYLQTKGNAEAIVTLSDLRWTVFRPSVIFGREDSFLNLFARLSRLLPIIALAAPHARFQPIYAGDVAHCFVQALDDYLTGLARFDLCGPRVYTLEQLVRYVGEVTGAVRPIIRLGPALSRLQATALEFLPGKLMSRDNLLSMQKDNVCDCPFPAVFRITPVALEAVAPQYLAPSARRSSFDPYRASGSR
jgi:NADH dehydrogenase